VHPTLKEEILEVLRNHPDIRLAIVFGSLASGSGSAESDLDLAVDARRPIDASYKMTLISDLAVKLGRPVDLVDLQTVESHCSVKSSGTEPGLSVLIRFLRN